MIAIALATLTLSVKIVAIVMPVIINPQVSFSFVVGFKSPLLVIMLITKVPESALVTRKIKIKQTAKKIQDRCPRKILEESKQSRRNVRKNFLTQSTRAK